MKQVLKTLTLALSLFFATIATAESKVFKVTLTADNTIYLNDYFDSETVAKVTKMAKDLDARLPSKEPLYFVLNSGGGSIDAGLELIENLQHLNRPVRTITLFAASMGFQTVEGLGTRLVTKNGTLMSHKAKGGFYGEFPGQLDSRYSYWLKRVNEMDKRAVARTKGKHTLESYKALVENEYWCDGQECIDQGFADLIVDASCDKSLAGTREDTIKFLWGAAIEISFIYDKCPLNTGLLDYQIYVNGEPVFKDTRKETSTYGYYGGRSVNDIKGLQEKIDEVISNKTSREVKRSY